VLKRLVANEAHRLTALHATAFLQSTIGNEDRYRRCLTRGYAAPQELPIDHDRRPIRAR